MKVRSKNKVEIRVSTPYRKEDNLKGLLYPGFNIEVVESVDGELINGNKTWYKDSGGDYYWSGGFEEDTGTQSIGTNIKRSTLLSDFKTFIKSSYNDTIKSINNDINYNDLLEIQPGIKLTKGNGIKIGILDHPVADEIKLFNNPIISGWSGERIFDHHGTFMAGLIAGYRKDKNLFEGISSNCSLISLPLYINGNHLKDNELIKNLKSFSDKFNNDKLVINISHEWSNPGQELIDFFEVFSEKHILIASAGEDNKLSDDDTIQWPASMDNVISVGAISQEYFMKNPQPVISRKVDIIIPDFNFISYTHSKNALFFEDNGDSCATAITTGIIALLISGYEKEKINKENIISELIKLNALREINAHSFDKLNLIIPYK